jgi:hypothetical protein
MRDTLAEQIRTATFNTIENNGNVLMVNLFHRLTSKGLNVLLQLWPKMLPEQASMVCMQTIPAERPMGV